MSTTRQLLARVVEQLERLEGQLEVLQRRDVQGGEQREHVAPVERGEHLVVEGRRGVHDDEVELLLEHVEHRRPTRLAGIDSAASGSSGATSVVRPGECGVSSDRDRRGVEVVGKRHRVGDRVRREQLQRDRHVAEGQVEVDQADLAPAAVGEGGGQVGGQGRLAAAALGGEDRDELAAGRGSSVVAAADRLALQRAAKSRARRTAALRPARSRSPSTSRTPARSASVSTDGVDAAADQDEAQARAG